MSGVLSSLKKYLPDPSVLDRRTHFDELAQPYFHKGSAVGCLVLHGIGGTPANVRVLSDALAQKGYTVFAPTLPGHGETVRALNASTDAQWFSCVLAGYERLLEEGCTQIFALGLSLGGVLCGLLAEEKPLDGLVMLCAPLRMTRFLRLARAISPLLPVVRYQSDADGETARQENPYSQMYDGFSTAKLHDLTRLTRRLKRNLDRIACPTLLISAEYDDKVDPVSYAMFSKGARNAPSLQRAHFSHSPHGCTYGPERDDIAACAASFVASHERANPDSERP